MKIATQAVSGRRLLREIEKVLRDRLPAAWAFQRHQGPSAGPDFVLTLQGPDGQVTTFVGEAKRTAEPRELPAAIAQLRASTEGSNDAIPLLVAAYLSPRSRAILEESNISYADSTGNVRVVVDRPGLYIQTQGSDRDPWPQEQVLQSLRSAGAARAVRAVVDSKPPFGVRELASKTNTPLASLSRVIDLLDREGLVTRVRRGPITEVNWQGIIRRWAADYDQLRSNNLNTYLDPRGVPAFESKVAESDLEYAATGAFAAQQFDPVAPARTAVIYVRDADEAADRLGLRPAESGANVFLLESASPVVFERTSNRSGLICVAPSQLAVDLLTGPGREPSQGEEILDWMKRNEDVWRT